MKREPPFDVPPGETVVLECDLDIAVPGQFATQVHIYLDDLGTREIIVALTGTATEK